MKFESVKSSYISRVVYDEKTKKMQVEFKNGAKWQYNEVPESAFVSMLISDSIGKFFANEIKGVFGARKLGDTEP